MIGKTQETPVLYDGQRGKQHTVCNNRHGIEGANVDIFAIGKVI
jgi:hypothetical protein